jgi:hypothetical protein
MPRWMSRTILLCFLCAAASTATWAQGTPTTDGHALLQRCTAALRVDEAGQGDNSTQQQALWCLGYVAGFADGHTLGTVEMTLGSPLLCPRTGGVLPGNWSGSSWSGCGRIQPSCIGICTA